MVKLCNILFAAGCIGSIFIYSYQFTDAHIVPKRCLVFLVLFSILLYTSIKVLLCKSISVNILVWGSIIVLGCVSQAFYGILQFLNLLSSHSIHKVTGSFDNPAGFASCLCIGLPFVLFLLPSKNKYVRYATWLAIIIIVTAVILSYSRAGIVSIAVLSSLFFYEKIKRRKILRYLVLTGLVSLLFGCYYMKKDSADGRLLIWKCSINMIKDAPLLGHGIGSFEAHYMDYQANYFRVNKVDKYSMLADNIKHPFNEYMVILLNFGIIGLLILLALLGWLVYYYKKKSNIDKKIAIYALLSISIFSFFSYPFTYPFTWIITLLSVYLIIKEHIKCNFIIPQIRNVIYILVLVISLGGTYKLIGRIEAELNWEKLSKLAIGSSCDEILSSYDELKSKFENNPYFLYNYAVVLMESKQYEKSLEVALQCRLYWVDYDLELIIGENYQYLKKVKLAEVYYDNAAMMCPSRFLPLYKLFYLYKSKNEMSKMFSIANQIINKPIKIEASSISRIKRDIDKEMQQMNISLKLE